MHSELFSGIRARVCVYMFGPGLNHSRASTIIAINFLILWACSDKCNIFKQFYEYTQYFFIFGLSICHNHFDIWIPDCNQDKLEVYLWMLENRFSDNKFWKKLKGQIKSKLSTVESPLSHTMNKSKWMGWRCFRIDKRNSSFHVLKVHFSKLHPKLSVDKSFKYSTESLASKCVLYFCNIYLFC